MERIYLSYVLDTDTPTYGNRNRFERIRKSSIERGDAANDTTISTTVHVGTHVDMPLHFYENGQSIEDFDADFWFFAKDEILFVEPDIEKCGLVIGDALISELEKSKSILGIDSDDIRLIVAKTGDCHIRGSVRFWEKNHGFHPDLAGYMREHFPNISIFGFDSISVSSFGERMLGREAHRSFLDPDDPILLLEDMDLRMIDGETVLDEVAISPMRIAGCDGLPCTVVASRGKDGGV